MRSGMNVALCSLAAIFAQTSSAFEVDQYKAFCACIVLRSLNNTSNAAEARRLLQDLSITPADQKLCENWNAYPNYEITTFVDSNAKPTNNLSEAIGIYASDIYSFCGPPRVEEVRLFPYLHSMWSSMTLERKIHNLT
jgi:hypothetical protein